MATITGTTNEQVFKIPQWLGLNEHPDGDTRLKLGEASLMRNFRITKDGNLKRRPGTQFVAGLRLTYTIATVNVPLDLLTMAADDTLTCYLVADPLAKPGAVTLSGTGTRMTPAQMSESSDVLYFWHDELPYRFGAAVQTEGGYLIKAFMLRSVPTLGTKPVAGMWSGYVGGHEVFLAACDGELWSLYNDSTGRFVRDLIGPLVTSKGVSFFPFDNLVYILNGIEYYQYDGQTLEPVEGYRPLVALTIGPTWTGEEGEEITETGVTTGEYVNRLNGKRRVWLSPDGTHGVFKMPEKNLASVDWVKDLATGEEITGWTADLEAGTVSLNPIPEESVNHYEVGYSVAANYRTQVAHNLFAELYSGTTDTRVFLYGDGTNRALYSGMDYDGQPRADYFPDQYEVRVGDENTPITSMIRHFSSLVCYKTDSCWGIEHGIVELATNELTPAMYCVPVNRDRGNVAPGQVRLVENNPVTAFGHELYQWVNSSYYNSNLSRDERQAERISDRVQESIRRFDLKDCLMWDDNDAQEFYVVQNSWAIVWNYANGTWYTYNNFDAVKMCNFQGELYLGTSDGRVLRLTELAEGDVGEPITAVWESGAIDFGADYSRKYSSMMWVGLKPEDGTSVDVTVVTDRKDTFRDKVVSSEKAKIDGQPFMVKTKIKAKKFVYYRLRLEVNEKMPPVTVTNVDFRVRQTGYAK